MILIVMLAMLGLCLALFMAEATFRAEAGILPYTPGSASSAGEVIQLANGRAAVVQDDLAAGELGSVKTAGHFDATAASGVTFIDGELVVWDASANTAINAQNADLADFPIGNATKAKVSGETVVRVELNSHFVKERKIIATAAAITLTAADAGATIYADTQAGAFTATLPTAASCKGERFTFIRTGTGTNALTIDGDSAETVDGGANVATMDAIRDTLTIESNGTAWFIVAARLA